MYSDVKLFINGEWTTGSSGKSEPDRKSVV